jgi:hypothetical protein
MVDPAAIHGRRIAMIAWGEKRDGSEDVAVFAGIANWDGAHLTMLRQPEGTVFPVPDEWLERLEPVDPTVKDILLGAEYCFSVTIGSLPEGVDLVEYLKTGLKWPDEPDAS